jgi:hypothetical protein
MEGKQTAVEFLFRELWQTPKDKMIWFSILKQAEAIEKEQIILAVDNLSVNQLGEFVNGEEYYNETYMK